MDVKRWLIATILGLAACGEPTAVKAPPTDRFAMPASLAVTARADGSPALLVASGNYDLTYDGATGGTILSVDPSDYVPDPTDPANPKKGTGSAGRPNGELEVLGAAQVGSYAGQMVVVDAQSCPGTTSKEVYLATRFADQLWRFPLGDDGEVSPCAGTGCVASVNLQLKDPFGLALACRAATPPSAAHPEGLPGRRSLFMNYLRVTSVSGRTSAWLAEVDLDAPLDQARIIPMNLSTLAGMAYLAETDQLLVLVRPLLAAPIMIVDLVPCTGRVATCPEPLLSSVNIGDGLSGLDLQSIALSNPQPGLGRRAYVTARVYDASLAAITRTRPTADVMGALLVLDLEPGPNGHPSFKVLHVVQTGMGASQIQVLPVRDPVGGVPRRDVVVVSSVTDGVLTVYDDEVGRVARYLPVDELTGAPEVGREPFGLAAIRKPGVTPPEVRVFVAASREQVVGLVDVPLDTPAEAHAVRDANQALVRIGGLQ